MLKKEFLSRSVKSKILVNFFFYFFLSKIKSVS